MSNQIVAVKLYFLMKSLVTILTPSASLVNARCCQNAEGTRMEVLHPQRRPHRHRRPPRSASMKVWGLIRCRRHFSMQLHWDWTFLLGFHLSVELIWFTCQDMLPCAFRRSGINTVPNWDSQTAKTRGPVKNRCGRITVSRTGFLFLRNDALIRCARVCPVLIRCARVCVISMELERTVR